MKANDLNREIERCNIKERMLRELHWAMEQVENNIEILKNEEKPDEEQMTTYNLKVEMITEMAKHIGKF